MNDNSYNNSLFKWLFALTTLYLSFAPLYINSLNYLFRVPSLLLIILLIMSCYQDIINSYRIAITTFILVLVVHFLVDTSFDFDTILASFSVVALLLLIIISEKIQLDNSCIRYINTCSILSALILVAYSLSPYANVSYLDGALFICPYLTFGFQNSNYAGIITFLIFSLLFITMQSVGKKTRWLCYILEAVLIYFIYLTSTRSALISALLLPLFRLYFSNFDLKKWMILVLCSIPFLFVPFYLYLSTGMDDSDAEIMGKSVMSGRQETFALYLESLKDDFHWWLGNLSENKFKNAHNGPLAIFVSTGLIGCFAYFWIFISNIVKANQYYFSKQSLLAIFVIISSFINTCGEAAFLLGGFPGITYLFTYFIIANSQSEFDNDYE